MKINDIALLSLAAALVIIGTHQTITVGIVAAYPIFMLSLVLLFWYKFRQNKRREQEQEHEGKSGKKENKRK
ncbi:hypothetical protein [Fontibacter flavus]|uniref:Uncharacterized protein n=1 Tax=Fontibacter flavus TaxID=654838 RepID=A0ABV6FPX1_9BACT